MAEPTKESWHLSKTVPLALIIAMIGQAFLVVWYGGNLTSEFSAGISSNTKDISRIEAEVTVMRNSAQEQAVQLARIEENTRNLSEAVNALVRTIEREQRERSQ